jgi:hypothetical protein
LGLDIVSSLAARPLISDQVQNSQDLPRKRSPFSRPEPRMARPDTFNLAVMSLPVRAVTSRMRAARRRPRRAGLRRTAAAAAGLAIVAAGCSATPSAGSQGADGGPSPGAVPTGGTGVASYGPVRPAAESPGTGNRSGVTGGALFGGTTTLATVQGQIGRRLAFVRDYYKLGQTFPNPVDRRLMASGSTLLVSLDTTPGDASYASIAAGQHDAEISAFLKAVNRAAIQYHLGAIYFCFEHEVNVPKHHTGLGSPGQFIQAWDHVHQLATSARLDWNQGGRIHWVFILTHQAFVPLDKRPRWARRLKSPTAYFPGKNEVDIVGVDGYNSSGCKANAQGIGLSSRWSDTTPASVFDPVLAFAHANGDLPVFIAEWGSTPFPVSRQSKFIQQMEKFVAGNREIAAVSYWNTTGRHCTYNIDRYPSSVAAMAAMGRSPALQGRTMEPSS